MKKIIALVASVLTISILGRPSGVRAPRQYGGTAVLGMYADIHTADLHRTIGNPTAQYGILIAEGLIGYDEECNFIPALAERWEASPDLSEWTFFLRRCQVSQRARTRCGRC